MISAWWRLPAELPGLLGANFGWLTGLIGTVGALTWLRQQPHSFVLLPAAADAVTFVAGIAALGEVVEPEPYLLPAMLVFALWVGWGLE